jgi:hypothetical protein
MRRRYYIEKPAPPVRWFGWRPEMDRDPDRCCVAPDCSRVAVRLNRCEPHARALEAARDLPAFDFHPVTQEPEPEFPGRCSRCGQTFQPGDGAIGSAHWPFCPTAPAPVNLDLWRASQEELPL